VSDKNFKVKSGLNIPIVSAPILITDSSGNIASSATLPISAGGTGQTSATNAINALLPVQNGSTINYTIQSDGTNISWAKIYNQGIQDSGITVTPRRNLNIVGATFTDSAGTDTTTVTFPLNTYARQAFTPTSGQTSFTLTNPIIIGSEQVFLNGILLVRGTDYTTPDTTTITLSSGAAAGDSFEVMMLNNITSSGVLANYKQEINLSISSNTTLVPGYRYYVNTSAARTLTLPANPSLGNEVTVFDASGLAGTNNITINSNSGKINGAVQDLTIDVDGAGASLIYTGATYGWRVG
jgi:hypothetical protein